MRSLVECAMGFGLTLVLTAGAAAQSPPPAPDNTKVNTRDRQAGAVTADQQTNAKSDVETTRKIRRAIMADKDLSTNAHNVKIVTRDGKVTLKGPVKTGDEKQAVEARAKEIAGASNVTSRISVTDSKPAKHTKKGR